MQAVDSHLILQINLISFPNNSRFPSSSNRSLCGTLLNDFVQSTKHKYRSLYMNTAGADHKDSITSFSVLNIVWYNSGIL